MALIPFPVSRNRVDTLLETLEKAGKPIVQDTRFGLADQVLTHMLVNAGLEVQLKLNAEAAHGPEASIVGITLERYALQRADAHDDTEPDHFLSADRVLQHWSAERLVAYILDHEVPVDPSDWPGFSDIKIAS